MALNGLFCADVPLRNYSLTHSLRVTWPQGGQNDHIFGIPKSTLPIHYATLVRLRWRLRVVCRWASLLLSIFIRNFSKSKNGPKICSFWMIRRENIKDECWDPFRKSVPTETCHSVQKIRRCSQKCVFQCLPRKVKKEKRKNNPVEHYISPFCPAGHAGPICIIFGM